jgi:regulator of replication initiation timing
MTTTDEITKLVEKVLVEKTFSLEIIDQIKKIRDDYNDLEKKFKEKETINKELYETNLKLSTENSDLKSKGESVSNREKIVAEKESKQALNDLELKQAQESKTEIKELFGIVFKNPIVRENVYKNKAIPNNQYGGYNTASESENKTIEKE